MFAGIDHGASLAHSWGWSHVPRGEMVEGRAGWKSRPRLISRKSTWYCSSLACSSSGRLEMALR